ncbi:hypothetical protein B9Z55_008785 [Caenorhabditis nigoni]|uniref:SCP domain-containing protein n=1 Tax=Caenorhabditis nigoni TaxID=1611254 RepID=A0A2G5UP86_9PELO|nr:hypothetical protein B9Z55_008785 [Caenorhabditis nigoni]
MKAVYSIVFLLLLAISTSTGVRVKRGLSTEEQTKLLNALNIDRQALGENMGIAFETLTYSRALEMKAENFRCDGPSTPPDIVPLKVNKVLKEMNDFAVQKRGTDVLSRKFFNPEHTLIGCSKEKTCSHTSKVGENAGKTKEYWGVCFFGPPKGYHFDEPNTPERAGMPKSEKYGDLLGVVGSSDSSAISKDSLTGSSGRFFSLTLFLGILSFYF